MDKKDISSTYAKVISTQEYGKEISIQGVSFLPLVYHKDDTGEFVELGRIVNGTLNDLPTFCIAQISSSILLPGAVKAFHLHFDQTDVWYVSPHQRLLVGLLDTRKTSPTRDIRMRCILGAGTAQLLVIPAGVAHGASNPWREPATLMYFTDRQFNHSAPDERRLPFDLFGEDFWTLQKG